MIAIFMRLLLERLTCFLSGALWLAAKVSVKRLSPT